MPQLPLLQPAAALLMALLKARTPTASLVKRPERTQSGVTPGGTYRDQDGQSWYVKQHRDPEHAYSEHLANVLYRMTGHNAPHTILSQHPITGNTTYLSKYMPGFKTQGAFHRDAGRLTPTMRDLWAHTYRRAPEQYLKGTAVDALVDAGDMHYENVGHFMGKNGEAHAARIDNGAALLHNAYGSRKARVSIAHVHEYRPEEQQATADALTAVGRNGESPMRSHDLLAPGLQQINTLHAAHDHNWQSFVDRHIPMASSSFRQQTAEFLTERHQGLQKHVQALSTGTAPFAAAGSARRRPASTRPTPELTTAPMPPASRLHRLLQEVSNRERSGRAQSGQTPASWGPRVRPRPPL